jgi:serine/threonine protein phosphatase PrpC
MGVEGSGASRAGGEGFHNEDAFVVEESLGLYVVCDGSSERPGGEHAAGAAVRALEDFVEHADEELDLRGDRVARSVVSRAMDFALRAVEEAEKQDPALRGLTTTVTLLLVHGERGVIGHRGDSRAYLIRRDRAHQLTVDHELTRALTNGEPADDFDVFGVELRPGDTIVLCTDGAEEVIEDPAIVRVAGELSPRLLASRIVSTAHRRNPGGDATVVVVRIPADREPGWLELSFPPRKTAFGHTLELA